MRDEVVATFFGVSPSLITAGLGVIDDEMSSFPNAGRYYLEGNGHVLLGNPHVASGGVVLMDWLGQMVTGDAAWAKAGPPSL